MRTLMSRNQRNPHTAASRTSTGWDPFHLMNAMLRGERHGSWLAHASSFVPTFEVKEAPDAYLVHADLPGVTTGDLEITVTGNALTVAGRRGPEQNSENARYYAMERGYGEFSRTFGLPGGANMGDLSADLKNGVLTIRIPKRPEARPRKISLVSPAESPMINA
jgi:HSP20 family protein